MDRGRLVTEATAQLAAEAVRLAGLQHEILHCKGRVPEALADELEHQRLNHQAAIALVLRLTNSH